MGDIPKSKTKRRTQHYFFLNPYENEAFTRCPKCNSKTKLRKYLLVIHVEPKQLLCLNKPCKYCEKCDLIIGKQAEIESLMVAACENIDPSMIGNQYVVFGTLDKADWRQSSKQITYPQETLDKVYIFKDVKHFEVVQGGWVKDS